MNHAYIDTLVAEWTDAHKKGLLSLWILLAISDSKKYAAQINEFMLTATKGAFEVKEQSLYRALRRFSAMGLVKITEEESPNSGPKRKYYELTTQGDAVLARFITINITPLHQPTIMKLLQNAEKKGEL